MYYAEMDMQDKLDEMKEICLSCLVIYDDKTNETTRLNSVKEMTVEMLRKLCYDEPEFMKAMKTMYIDLCMTRWEDIDEYARLTKYSPLVFLIERTVMGIMMEEAIDDGI